MLHPRRRFAGQRCDLWIKASRQTAAFDDDLLDGGLGHARFQAEKRWDHPEALAVGRMARGAVLDVKGLAG